jgi:predicted Rossmann fold nucleotide-binding protein DprA/Smf involved in DNA uptake
MQHVHTALLAYRFGNTSAGVGRLAKSLFTQSQLLVWADQYRTSCDPELWRRAERSMRAMQSLDIHTVAITSLPLWFRVIQPQVLMLFVRGNPALLEHQGVGIVGSRKATPSVCVGD